MNLPEGYTYEKLRLDACQRLDTCLRSLCVDGDLEEENEGWELAKLPLTFPHFLHCPASSTPDKHHFHRGGLLLHSVEVLEFAISQATEMGIRFQVDWEALVAACMWHDLGKIDEYSFPMTEVEPAPLAFRFDDEVREVSRNTPPGGCHHITAAAFQLGRIQGDSFRNTFRGSLMTHVLHLIESHHGRREWGSPNPPKTPEALILHQADMLSVMLDGGTNPGDR